jgi:hypothetical protein
MEDRKNLPAKSNVQAAREKRLAEALRANLKRRKAAAKTTASGPDAGSEGSGAGRSPPKEREG